MRMAAATWLSAPADMGARAISTGDRGAQKKIAIPFRRPPPDCIGCLSCVHVCPTSVIKYEDKGDVRKIWGNTFRMVKCEDCGRPFMTEAQRDFEMKRTGLSPETYAACPDCRKRATVEKIGETF